MEARGPNLQPRREASSREPLQDRGFYFVLEGHYWVSVARYHGLEWIDAEVTEFGSGSHSDRVAGGDQLPEER